MTEQKAPRFIRGMNASPLMAHGWGFGLQFLNVCARIETVHFKQNSVRVAAHRVLRKNATALFQMHTLSLFLHVEFVRSRALAGRASTNERKTGTLP